MIDISISKLNKNFGSNQILNNISFDIHKGEIVSLIGENGCGKSTLLKIIAELETTDNGDIFIRKGSKIGYLKQIPDIEEENIKVKDILYRSVKNITDIEDKLREYEIKMSGADEKELQEIFRKYSNLQEKYIEAGGYEIKEKIGRIVTGFKLTNILNNNFNTLSGGEKRITVLASIMITNPDILLLDEPTNHLDIDTLEWFEKYLKSYKKTVLIVSHDRYFLDKVATKTILIERGAIEIFHGNYSYYLKENEKRILSEFENYKNQQKQIEAMKKSIKKLQEFGRLAYPGGEPFFKRAASIQKRLDKLELLDKPLTKKELPLDFRINNRTGKDVLILKDLDIKICDNILIKKINLKINYGEKICLMGKNGTGKSTLIKAILNNDNYFNQIKLWSNVSIGYIPQEIKFDNEFDTVLDTARRYFEGEESHLRSALSKFLFYGKSVFKRVGNLSGGEKVRLKLFELIQKKANFLIMDEPTNHIDIATKEMLEDALEDYKGTLLFISHDRYFINKLAKKILYIENNEIKEYIGDYDYYKEIKERKSI